MLLYGVERSRRLFFPVAVASRFFLNSGCFAKSGTANGGGAFMQGVKHPQLLDNRSSRESLAQSAFAFPNAFEIENCPSLNKLSLKLAPHTKVRRMKAEGKRQNYEVVPSCLFSVRAFGSISSRCLGNAGRFGFFSGFENDADLGIQGARDPTEHAQ